MRPTTTKASTWSKHAIRRRFSAYAMNGAPLTVAHGAPVRLRCERQLGYKHAKYVERIELVESFGAINGGKGGYWEDQGYAWWAGI